MILCNGSKLWLGCNGESVIGKEDRDLDVAAARRYGSPVVVVTDLLMMDGVLFSSVSSHYLPTMVV